MAIALMDRANTVPPDSGTAELEQAATALRELGCSRILVGHYNGCAYSAIKLGTPERARPFLAEAVPLARELGAPVVVALTCGNIGLEALLTDDLDRAQKAFDEELRVCREHVVHQFAGEGLGGLAAIATRRDDLERAALLLGAANATRTGVGDAYVTAQLEEQFFAPAPAAHGTRDWDEAQARGAQMSVNEAIAFALGGRDRPRFRRPSASCAVRRVGGMAAAPTDRTDSDEQLAPVPGQTVLSHAADHKSQRRRDWRHPLVSAPCYPSGRGRDRRVQRLLLAPDPRRESRPRP